MCNTIDCGTVFITGIFVDFFFSVLATRKRVSKSRSSGRRNGMMMKINVRVKKGVTVCFRSMQCALNLRNIG